MIIVVVFLFCFVIIPQVRVRHLNQLPESIFDCIHYCETFTLKCVPMFYSLLFSIPRETHAGFAY